MIPAKLTCPTGWTREYPGYLMTESWNQSVATYECVFGPESIGETVPKSEADTDGGTFYHVEANCNGMPCPPYNPQKELSCVVCTR